MKKQQTIEKAREMSHEKVVTGSDASDSDEHFGPQIRLSQLHSDWMSKPACRFIDSRRQRENLTQRRPAATKCQNKRENRLPKL